MWLRQLGMQEAAEASLRINQGESSPEPAQGQQVVVGSLEAVLALP